ncbi:beta-galactosidase 11-like isoform X1 [Carex littledalei]|uniref:beta-galactosidase n=1 Tax=Carex littledalei TaxID=544730 RepID=A0A833QHM6_9POAL|nr:beta-galactosidase 11-like isoform X1 [Carex littledalei]
MKAVSQVLRLVAALFVVGCFANIAAVPGVLAGNVTYDGRSLIINGKRELIFSGSIHYPRSQPALWPDLLEKAKQGGLNAISTYVFWNVHEPTPGKFNFVGQYDLAKFIKLVQKNGMYAILRIGPFIQAEWSHGGFPFWLREVEGITFRTNNEPFKVENEYSNIAATFDGNGTEYVQWAANMAHSTNIGVPWIMCKQKDAPGTVIPTCNGRNCGDTFVRKDHTKPIFWTENWTAQYRVFGDPPSQRSAEDLAYAVVRFFSKMGTLTNYYMYHGGTNFGRNGASFVMTRYYDEAPLDEFGLLKEPKWGHLRDMHHALRLSRKGLLWGTPSYKQFKKSVEVNAQHNSRTFQTAKQTQEKNVWKMYKEPILKYRHTSVKTQEPQELFEMTKDKTDYAWYSTSFRIDDDDLPRRRDIRPVLQVRSFGHALNAFVNGKYIGTGHGTKVEGLFQFSKPMDLKPGTNHISILGVTVGLPDSGPYLEHRMAGPDKVVIQGLNTGTLDLSANGWGHEVGLVGEKMEIYKQEGATKVQWTHANSNQQVTWYKRYFDEPYGSDPVSLDMSSMGKGILWVNGHCLGRYWVSYLSPLGKPSQSVYHVPRSFLKPKDNLLVLFEEQGGKPEDILIMTVKRDNICTFVSEYHTAHSKSWSRQGGQIKTVAEDMRPHASLRCLRKKIISKIVFASFGNPMGMCGNFTAGTCHSPHVLPIVEKLCLGKRSCSLPVTGKDYAADINCPDTTSTLAVQAKCSRRKRRSNHNN